MIMTCDLDHLRQRAKFAADLDSVVHTQDDLMIQWTDNLVVDDEELDVALVKRSRG